MLGLVVALFVNAQIALEETNGYYTQSAAYVEAQNIPYFPTSIPKSSLCSCVLFAKEYIGRQDESWGTAKYIQPNYNKPIVGGLVLTYESPWGHVGVITSIQKDGFWIVEGNYKPCQKTERFIPNDSPLIRGFRVF